MTTSTTTSPTTSTSQAAAANPNQQYWDLGLSCFNEGQTATATMQALYNAWLPPFNLNLLAAIVGALYGDTYWARTRMDRDLMAYNLQAALGMNPADCQKAANFAFSKWYGLQVRANMSDQGQIPRDSNVTNSPDVVVNGQAPLSVQQLINLWNVYTWDLAPGLKNYAYGRAQSLNIQLPITAPVLRMYYSDAGFNPPPSSWVKLFTFTGSSETSPLQGVNAGPIPVGGRSANVNAFGLNVPGSGHYCAISVAGSEFFTNNPSDSGGNWDSYEWITNDGAAGWHNIDVSTGKEETLNSITRMPPRSISSSRRIPARCLRELEISLGFEDRKLAGAIRTVGQNLQQLRSCHHRGGSPAHYTGNLVIQLGGKPLPAGASIDCRLLWALPSTHKNYLQAVAHLGDTRAVQRHEAVRVQLGNFTFIGK